MITYQVERLDDVYKEIQYLLRMHWEEIAVLKDVIELKPSYEMYKQLEMMGKLYILTVREEGGLVGYFVAIITKNPHYMDEVWAMNDIMFLHPNHRKGRVGALMILKAQEDLKNLGATVVTIHAKIDHPIDALMERLGYTPNEVHFIRKL